MERARQSRSGRRLVVEFADVAGVIVVIIGIDIVVAEVVIIVAVVGGLRGAGRTCVNDLMDTGSERWFGSKVVK